MSFSILVVDDEPDVADLFRQHFRREARQGIYVLHFAGSGEEALQLLAHGIEPQLNARDGRADVAAPYQAPAPRSAGDDGDRLR